MANTEPEVQPKQRWIMAQFFSPSWTKNLTLDELRNGNDNNVTGVFDATDLDVAKEILRRAGLVDHFRYEELSETLSEWLADIDDPRTFINPNAKPIPEPRDEQKEQEVAQKEQTETSTKQAPVTNTPKSGTGTSDSPKETK